MIPIPDNNVEIGQARQMNPNDILRIKQTLLQYVKSYGYLTCLHWSIRILFNLRAKLVKRAGGLYSGVCNYCNSYDNKIFIFMFIVYCYFFPSE